MKIYYNVKNTYVSLKEYIMVDRPETTELSHFNATNFIYIR